MTTPLSGTPLNPDEQRFCAMLGITTGIDRDDCTPQLTHLCWPYDLYWGALCGTDKLREETTEIPPIASPTCQHCFQQLKILQAKDPVLLAAIGSLHHSMSLMNELHEAVRDYLGAQNSQENRIPTDTPLGETIDDLDMIVEAIATNWNKRVETNGNRPQATPNGWELPKPLLN